MLLNLEWKHRLMTETILRQAVLIYKDSEVLPVGFGYVFITSDGQNYGPDPEMWTVDGELLPADNYDVQYTGEPLLMVTTRKVQ